MNVLIIPEDFRNDQFILKPIFEGLFEVLGKPRAKVVVCKRPLLGGVAEALKAEKLEEVFDLYRMVDIFILCVDRDGNAGRRNRLDQLEERFRGRVVLFSEAAWEELETWALAALPLPADWSWAAVRADVSVKENYFLPYANSRRVSDGPGQGRRALGLEAKRRIDLIRLRCPDDFGALARKLAVHLDV